MKNSAKMNKWDDTDYQRIIDASIKDNIVNVKFANNDSATFPLNVVLSTEKAIDSEQISFNPYEVIIVENSKDITIPWDTIRAITDRDYSKFLAEEGEQEAKSIGVKIRRLREKRNLKANELSELSGVTPQTISRIEKGHTDISFGTLKKILGAMGYSLKDLAEQEELELEKNTQSIEVLLKKLVRAGIDSNFITKRLIPKSLLESIKTIPDNSKLLIDEITKYIKRVYGWTEDELWESKSLKIDNYAFNEAYYKTPSKINLNQIKAYSHYAYYLANTLLKVFPKSNIQTEYPGDIDEFKENYYSRYKELEFDCLLNYIWDLGICVLPLNDSGVFHGASWNIEGRHIIIIKQTTQVHARWIFDLLHEVYHVFAHLDKPNTSIVELEELTPFLNNESEEELEANTFANQVIFGKRAEELAMLSIEKAEYRLENLKQAVKEISKLEKIREDFLSNYLAFRLQLQKQNWWGTASKMQISNPSPFDIATRILKERVSIDKLNSIDANLLLMAINN